MTIHDKIMQDTYRHYQRHCLRALISNIVIALAIITIFSLVHMWLYVVLTVIASCIGQWLVGSGMFFTMSREESSRYFRATNRETRKEPHDVH